MTVDLAALAKLASEATPGPWTLLDDGWVWGPPSDDGIRDPICETLSDIYEVDPDAAYIAAAIAAASPDVVAALCRVALAAKAALPAVGYGAGAQAQAGLGDPWNELYTALKVLE